MKDFLRSARDVFLGTLASRILGLVRDAACAVYFSSYSLDAFYLALVVPNLLRRLFGEGAMASSFIPVFAEIRENEGEKSAAEFTRITFTALTVVLLGCFFILRMGTFAAGMWLTSDKMKLFLSLLNTMLPFLIFICLSALFAAVLNSLGSFALPAAGQAILNMVWIAGVLVLERVLGVRAAAVGVLAGGVVQCLILVPAMARRGISLGFRWNFSHPGLKKLVTIAGPVTLGFLLVQINVAVDRIVAETMIPGNGAVSALYFGNRLIQLPLALFGIAIATAVFPALSSCAARGDYDGMKVSLRQALRTVFFVAVPSAIGLAVMRHEIVSLLFQYGEFTSEMVYRTGTVIVFYAAGLWAYCGIHVATRFLYSLQDMKTPIKIASAMVILNLILNLALVGRMKEGGLALATAITSAMTFVLLLAGCTRKIGIIGLGEIFISFAKTGFCSIVMGFVSFKTAELAASWIGAASVGARLTVVLAAICTGLIVFVFSAVLLKCPEVKEIYNAFLRKREMPDHE